MISNVDLSTQTALLTVEQVAATLSVSKRTVWRMLSAGELIKPIRIRGNTRWRHSDLQEWIDADCPRQASNEQ